MSKKLLESFFDRDPQEVAQDLLGKIIRVKYQQHWLAAQVIETEAYYIHEKGSHASLGFTQKRKALFMPAGTIYMYYSRAGDSLNISCHGEGNAVLIKSAIPYEDANTAPQMIQIMQQLNPQKNNAAPRPREKLCCGQALLCKSLGLKVLDWDQKNFDFERFYFEDVGYRPEEIIQAKRLGIPLGRDEHLPYRFVDASYAKVCTRAPGSLDGVQQHQGNSVQDFVPSPNLPPQIIITRPLKSSHFLAEKIEQAGGKPIVFPTLEIRDVNQQVLKEARLESYAIAIFTSANAVEKVLPFWPKSSNLIVMAIGRATAQALQAAGIYVDFSPESKFNSEALLGAPFLQASFLQTGDTKKIVIFSGENGRSLLLDTLRERGAQVTKIAVYKRLCPVVERKFLLQVWQQTPIAAVISTSCESLENLYQIVAPEFRERLLNLQLIVISERMAELALSLGFKRPPIVTEAISDAAIFEALVANVILA
jgi:DNA-3-methyladenine glycosylase